MAFSSVSGCAFSCFNTKFDAADFLMSRPHQPDGSSQVLLVQRCGFWIFTRTIVYVMEQREGNWSAVSPPMDAVIGRNGFAPPGEKREGDGKTPSGIFPLVMAFGYADSANTKMLYRQIKEDDIWVDDSEAADYNRWTKQSVTQSTSYERMKRDDDLYKYGIVIAYNTDPVVQGRGSAIFVHVWKDKSVPTAGCVAVSEENILRLLHWLDPAAAPLIIMGLK
ncbi:MAG TPA: L,D-transpeptidase family protein [Smithella sp.]|nr:L,D-transpeptidase family protein [Smithella sp.]